MNVMSFPIDDMLLPLRGDFCESSQIPLTLSTADGFMPFQGGEDTHAPKGQHRLTCGNT